MTENEHTTDLSGITKKIKSLLTKGDVSRICREAGFLSTGSSYRAMKKTTWSELTPGEAKVINIAASFLEDKKRIAQESIDKVAAL
jgi:hypothetical protein